MVNDLRKLFEIVINKDGLFEIELKKYVFFLTLLFITPFIEMISFGSILPVITIIAEPEYLANNTYFNRYFPGISALEKNDIARIFVIASLAAFFFRVIIALLTSWKQSVFLREVQISISKRLFLSYLNKNFSEFHNKKISSYLQNLTSEIAIVVSSLLLSLSTLFMESLVVALIGLALILLKPMVVLLVVLSWLIFYNLLLTRFNRYLKALGKTRAEYEKNYIDIINQSFKSILEIKIYKAKKYFFENFYDKCRRTNEIRFLRLFLRNVPRVVFEFLMFFAILIVLYFSINSTSSENLVVSLSVFAMGIYRLMPSINRINESINSIHYSMESYRLLCGEIGQEKLDDLDMSTPDFSRNVKLREISYRYEDSGEFIFKNINFDISKGDKICIIGESGQGKSTLLKILSGLIVPTSGEILVDDVKIDSTQHDLSGLLSYVPQDTYLFTGSLLENITFSSEADLVNQDRLNRAVEISRISNLLVQFADKQISDLMKNISGGQYQRIGIARALYKDSDMLFFDEPTSALDPENAFHIFSKILKLENKTVICVTHNPELASMFDRVYELSNGGLNEYRAES